MSLGFLIVVVPPIGQLGGQSRPGGGADDKEAPIFATVSGAWLLLRHPLAIKKAAAALQAAAANETTRAELESSLRQQQAENEALRQRAEKAEKEADTLRRALARERSRSGPGPLEAFAKAAAGRRAQPKAAPITPPTRVLPWSTDSTRRAFVCACRFV